MKRQQRILTGTALGLLMASSPLAALPLKNDPAVRVPSPLILAQAEGDGSAESGQPPVEQAAPEPQPEPVAAPEPAPAVEQAPAPQPEPIAAPEPVAAPEAAPVVEQAPAPEPAPIQAQQEPAAEPPAEPEQPRKKRKESQEQTEQAPAEQPAPAEAAPAAEPEQPRKKRKQSEEQAEPAPAEQPAPAEAAPAQQEVPAVEPDQPRKKPRKEQAEPAAEQPAPVEKAPDAKPAEPEQKPAEPEQKPAESKPVKQEPAAKEEPTQAKPSDKPAEAKPADKPAEPEAKPAEQPAQGGEKPASEQAKPAEPAQGGEKPATGEQKPAGQGDTSIKPAGEPQPGEQPKPGDATQPAQGGQPPAPAEGGQQPAPGEQKPATQPIDTPANPNAAPIFDSQKDAQPPINGQKGDSVQPQQPGQPPAGQPVTQPAQPVQQPAEKVPPPKDDKAAQVTIQPEKIVPVTEEKGTRLERAPDFDVRRRPRPEGADIVKNFGDRTIIQFNNQIIVESNDRPRITRDAQDVYYEDLPRGRTRETIVRDNGNQIITIRNRNGDIIRRSRITPDGHEYVLSYVDERYYEDINEWRDPGDELPPIYIDIPRQEYILESEYVRSPDDYYVFLERPPVEKVKRLYSIDEVKRSARVRDIARRIDLDTLNFEFGSATIPESEVEKLQGVADAMQKLLAKNPAETFLIEGHTDAVGSDVANLALSDRRAEAVANALSSVFDVPPENLSTQGYGERYLKVKTQKPERENRRVAIRRITPLVAPVASAK
ncbi:Peptidoglycan-associated lipoprotein [Mycolicibacterium aubagnense]